MPRKEVVIGVAAQDVQISGSMTGGHVGATPSSPLTDEGSPKFLFGALISGAVFFGVLFFSLYKEKYLADKKRNQIVICISKCHVYTKLNAKIPTNFKPSKHSRRYTWQDIVNGQTSNTEKADKMPSVANCSPN